MVNRGSFTPEEWETLQFTPYWVASGVATADGTVDELEEAALSTELQQTADVAATPASLWQQVVGSLADAPPAFFERFNADQRSIPEGLGDVADIVEAHVSAEEAEEFKRSALGVGVRVASASGGDAEVAKQQERELRKMGMPKDFARAAAANYSRMSAEEKAALEVIQAALRLANPVR
jgi:hypothetical protein